jgi:exodeoxyribonuclease VII large subunit
MLDSVPNDDFANDEIYSITEFLKLCHNQISKTIPSCWLQGEVSNLFTSKSGHIYFSIKDESAQVKCVLFRLNQRNLKFNIENNLSFLIRAKASIYQNRGEFQLIVEQIEPTGIGSLQLAFEQLKQQLTSEGLFANEHKKALPKTPKRIGVITSFGGAVIKDILKVLTRRYPFTTISIYDTLVQGSDAPRQITYAIKQADSQNNDVLIVARGGGSLEDLWAFNEEIVIRTIFTTKTPIISAIGHQTDTTLSDFVADVRAATPSVAAEIVVLDKEQLVLLNKQLNNQLVKQQKNILRQHQEELKQLFIRIKHPQANLDYVSLRLDDLTNKLEKKHQDNIQKQQVELMKLTHKLNLLSPLNHLKTKQQQQGDLTKRLFSLGEQMTKKSVNDLREIIQKLKQQTNQNLYNQQTHFSKTMHLLDTLSPLKTLSRGYSITLKDNIPITSIEQIKKDDVIVTKLVDGVIQSKIFIEN